MDRYVLVVQAVLTVVFLGFAAALFFIADSATANTMATVIVTATLTHWFKESSTIARKAATSNVHVDEAGVVNS